MYYITKRFELAGCHRLDLSYESKCTRLHGHNWMVTAHCMAEKLNEDGMVVDFSHIKERITSYLDHGNFNELLPFNPTAEHMAKATQPHISTQTPLRTNQAILTLSSESRTSHELQGQRNLLFPAG